MTTSLDIPRTRPLSTLETKGATYRHKALSKTGRTSKPYAPIATVFLFTRKIILNALRVSSFDVCLLKEGIGGAHLRNLPPKEKLTANRTARIVTETLKQRIAILMQGISNLVTNVRARTHLVGAFSATHTTKVTLPTPPLFRLNFAFKTLHMQNIASQRFVLHHETAVASFDIGNNRLRFEGRPAKGSRPPHAEQSQGEITETSPSGHA